MILADQYKDLKYRTLSSVAISDDMSLNLCARVLRMALSTYDESRKKLEDDVETSYWKSLKEISLGLMTEVANVLPGILAESELENDTGKVVTINKLCSEAYEILSSERVVEKPKVIIDTEELMELLA